MKNGKRGPAELLKGDRPAGVVRCVFSARFISSSSSCSCSNAGVVVSENEEAVRPIPKPAVLGGQLPCLCALLCGSLRGTAGKFLHIRSQGSHRFGIESIAASS